MKFKQGGQIIANTPYSLIFNGWVDAPPTAQIAGGTGTVQFLFGLYPEWVGQRYNLSNAQAFLQSVGEARGSGQAQPMRGEPEHGP